MENIISESERIIGHYRGAEPGPLVVAIGGIHGNEPAGVQALERLFDLLEEEPRLNPAFSFRGELLALRGNVAALREGKRYVDADMNRIWRRLPAGQTEFDRSEDRELYELITTVETALEESPLSELVLLDLHTTTADGGIFAVTADDAPSLSLTAELSVPVIRGMLDAMQGTSLHYFQGGNFGNQRVRALIFEAGRHDDPASADLALAATVNLLRALGCVRAEDVSTYHDNLLRESAGALPLLTELAYVHRVAADGSDGFAMLPGYLNFQAVAAGEHLANDHDGPIYCPTAGFLLMPLYQKLGGEGFFLLHEYKHPLAY